MHSRSTIRTGAALVTAMVFLVLLSSVAVVLTERTVSALTMERHRTEELTLMMASESGANAAYVYVQSQSVALLHVNDTYAQKLAVPLPTEAQLEAKHAATLIDSTTLGLPTVNNVPVTVRWCYLGQRAVKSGNNATTGDWEITSLSTFVDETSTPLTAAQVTAGYVVQDMYKVRSLAVIDTSADANRWRQRQVDMIFSPTSSQVLTKALFSKIGYSIQGSPSGDKWNSQGGTVTYATGPVTTPIQAGSNASVTSTTGTISCESNMNLTMPMPDFDGAPAYNIPVACGGPNVINATSTLSTGTYHAQYIDIDREVLTINGVVTVYVDGPVSLVGANGGGPDALVYATAASKLTIIQNDHDPDDAPWSAVDTLFELNGNSYTGATGNPQQFIVVSAFTGEGRLNGNGDFGGVIYAPNLTLSLNGNFDYYGAIMCNSFDGMINGNFHMHYDESLADMSLPVNAGFSVAGWYASNPVWGGGTVR